MAYQFNTNVVPLSMTDAIYRWKEFMKSVGWVVTQSGTGTGGTFSGSSDLITAGGAIANTIGTLGTALCWFVIRDPAGAGGRSYCFQHSNSAGGQSNNWRVKYSQSAGFSGGSPSASQTPSASDEAYLCGGGTDAASTFSILFPAADGLRRFQMLADNAAPYGFYCVCLPFGSGSPDAVMMLDPLVSGSYDAGDVDPVVNHFASEGGCFITGNTSFNGLAGGTSGGPIYRTDNNTPVMGPSGWLAKGLTGGAYLRVCALVPACFYSSSALGAAAAMGLGTNPITGKDELFPIFWARPSGAGYPGGPFGMKGISTFVKSTGTSRSTSDTLTVVTPRDYIVVGQMTLPWNGTIPAQ